MTMRRYFIKTYGCQMNVADSAKLKEVLESAGYQNIGISDGENQISEYQKADIILVNTCVVRQNAEDRAAWFIQSLKGQKKVNPNLKIGVCGCFVTEPGRDLKKQFPHVDFFIPPNNSDKLAEYLHLSLSRFHNKYIDSGSRKAGDIGHWSLSKQGKVASNFVSIMHGCDNFCSYCVVPYVRGREVSRPMDEVLAEIKGLVDQGVTDITLLGQNVNSYKFGLAILLKEIQQLVISNLSLVIRFMTCHPRDMSDGIIEAVAELPYVAKEFMIPLQSGNNEILKWMNRGYTLEHYLGRIDKIRSLMPKARIITDILVGFPGETEEQFQNTLKAIEQIRFDEVHMFAFSPRPNTAAAALPGQLAEDIKQARLQKLIEVVREIVR